MAAQNPMTESALPPWTGELVYRPRRIVCPIDLGGVRGGLRAASSLARRGAGALHVIHAIERPAPVQLGPEQPVVPGLLHYLEEIRSAAASELQEATEAIVERLEHAERLEQTVTHEVLVGSPFRCITEYADRVDADLVVMASRDRRGILETFLGSVAERVIRLAEQPVLTVPPTADDFVPQRVLVATDLRPSSDRALPVVRYLAEAFEPEITLAHVIPRPVRSVPGSSARAPIGPDIDYWRRARVAATEGLGIRRTMLDPFVQVDTALIEAGDPGREIVELASRMRADLVVCGTRGNTGLSRLLLGSIAEKIVRTADCAVLAVPPDTFEQGVRSRESPVHDLPDRGPAPSIVQGQTAAGQGG